MRLPLERGPVSGRVTEALRIPGPPVEVTLGPGPVLDDADAQLALWILYELHYHGFDEVAPSREWDPGLISVRLALEARMEAELRAATAALVDGAAGVTDVADAVFDLVARADVPPLSAYLQRHATREQVVDYLRERSIQQLKESDPQSFLLPRLGGAAKVALAEVQYDEYGAGEPARLHQNLYADAMRAAGLDDSYGAYIDEVAAPSLASANIMSLLCLNRRLLGAAAGHFAAFEATSSVPSRKVAAGIERVGLPSTAAAYFHEHVEADAVHEQIASREICGSLVASEPHLREDVLFGAAACVHVDSLASAGLLDRWRALEEVS